MPGKNPIHYAISLAQFPNFIIFFKVSGYQNISFIYCFTQFLQAHMLTFKKVRFLREGTLFLPQNKSNWYCEANKIQK